MCSVSKAKKEGQRIPKTTKTQNQSPSQLSFVLPLYPIPSIPLMNSSTCSIIHFLTSTDLPLTSPFPLIEGISSLSDFWSVRNGTVRWDERHWSQVGVWLFEPTRLSRVFNTIHYTLFSDYHYFTVSQFCADHPKCLAKVSLHSAPRSYDELTVSHSDPIRGPTTPIQSQIRPGT
jgi:hypothetical protein